MKSFAAPPLLLTLVSTPRAAPSMSPSTSILSPGSQRMVHADLALLAGISRLRRTWACRKKGRLGKGHLDRHRDCGQAFSCLKQVRVSIATRDFIFSGMVFELPELGIFIMAEEEDDSDSHKVSSRNTSVYIHSGELCQSPA